MIPAKQAPYTGPWASDATKHPSEGRSVRAIKIGMVRLGFMEERPEGLTDRWPAGGVLDKGFRKWERSRGMPGDGVYGEQEWKALRAATIPSGPKKGQAALNSFACKLLRADYEEQNEPDEEDFRRELARFCLLSEANEDPWHYGMVRPLDESVEPTANYVLSDCSFYVKQAYWWARQKSGLLVPDPAKQGWGTGLGNTEWYENDWPRVEAPWKIGDLAHYPGHVTLCRRPGFSRSSVFSSHGQEAGPIPTSVYYRDDFLYVVRPSLKPEED